MEFRTIARKGRCWIETASQLYDTRLKLKELRLQEENLCTELKDLSDYKNAFGGSYLFTVSMRKGAVDYEIVPEIKGVDLEKYRKEDVANWKLQKIE